MAKKSAAKKAGAAAAEEVDKDAVKVKKSLLQRAVKALVQVVEKKSANTNPLLGATSDTIFLYFTMTNIPDKRKIKPVMIPLPHPMYNDKSEVCFLSKDPQKDFKELLLQKHPVPGITKVIGIDKLRRNYKSLEQKRALADAFDLFLCDISILEAMPKILGNTFYKNKKKAPIPVRLREADPETNLKKALSGTPLRMPAGPCLTVKIGRVSMDEESLIANAASVIAHVTKHLKQQDNLVQSITVKTTDSPALPIWRRPRPDGPFLDLKKYHSDSMSSAASETQGSVSESGPTSDSEFVSDAGETLSTRDTVSEIDTAGESLSELETGSELDDEAGDLDSEDEVVEELPLVKGLKGTKRKHGEVPKASPKQSPKASPRKSPKAAPEVPAKKAMGDMGPPKAKKAKKKA
eukprot:TRINITY_DN58223_c0_g1_i1.p1 TRINITY_DN58223_c0_g1~~TRINITY_DN58223_c0_g1_i1.p1  ORF type:complete len:430 (-),score=132.87 TRINITY_DN58223_c0_g1_i1:158-1378(-)